MEKKELIALLRNPGNISVGQTAALTQVLEQFPYFQAARAVRLKGLLNHNSLHYNKELKVTAAYTVDRGVLFDFITSEEFDQNQIAEQIRKEQQQEEKPLQKPEEEKDQLTLDQALKNKIREEELLKPSLPVKEQPEKKPQEKEKSKADEALELGKPLHFNRNESHSFSEWLKLTSAKPVDRTSAKPQKKLEKRSRKFELIDEFISKSPRINPSQPSKKSNLAEERLTSPEALMTETLARVYLEQRNFKKAIQAYKILILKNPEKSGFFADQIRAIEKIKEQNNLEE